MERLAQLPQRRWLELEAELGALGILSLQSICNQKEWKMAALPVLTCSTFCKSPFQGPKAWR